MTRAWLSTSLLVALVAAASCERSDTSTAGRRERARGADDKPAHSNMGATTQPAKLPSDDAQPHERLYGTWVANDVSTQMGDVKIQLTFREEGPVRILAWSELPFVGQVRSKQAPYDVNDNTITSDAIRGGTTVRYRFDSGDLVIEYKDGKFVRFRRQA